MVSPLRVSAVACAAAVLAFAVSSGGLSRPDGMIERSFAQAFGTRGGEGGPAPGPAVHRHEPTRLDPAHLHLSRLPATTLGPALALGDRIIVAARNGAEHAYEVVDVRPLAGEALGEAGSDTPPLLVTARSIGTAPAQTIRLVIDAGERTVPTGAAVGLKPHAL